MYIKHISDEVASLLVFSETPLTHKLRKLVRGLHFHAVSAVGRI